MAALAGSGVPVPPVVLYHPETDVLDTSILYHGPG